MKKQLNILIPYQILSLRDLTLSDKLVYGFHYSLKRKKGFSEYTNTAIGESLNIHYNNIGKSLKNLVKKGFILREGTRYSVTDKYEEIETLLDDKRNILIPFEVYNTSINTGAKLLWGEYNSKSKGEKEYFVKRVKTAIKLGVSEQSITNWTKELYETKFLTKYINKYGYKSTQRIVVTCKFERDSPSEDFDKDYENE